MTERLYAPGSIVANRSRLWRVDAHLEDVLTATPIDGEPVAVADFSTNPITSSSWMDRPTNGITCRRPTHASGPYSSRAATSC